MVGNHSYFQKESFHATLAPHSHRSLINFVNIARSAKFLQTTQKQFRSAKTNCANKIT